MPYILTILLLLAPTIAHASDPFELPHPTTKEPGVWIPLWAQRATLEMNVQLNICTRERGVLQDIIEEKNAEIADRISATTDLRTAVDAQTRVMADLKQKLDLSKARSERNLIWALVATGGAVLTGTVLTIVAVN